MNSHLPTPFKFSSRTARRLAVFLVLFLSLGLTIASPAHAEPNTSFDVNTLLDGADMNPGDGVCDASPEADNQCTLRAAIMETNAHAGTDTIQLGQGIFTLALPGEDDTAAVGDLDILDDLNIYGWGPDFTIIDGAGLDRIFHLPNYLSDNVLMKGVTLQNGYKANTVGGAIYNAANLTLEEVNLRGNEAFGAAGLYNAGTLIAQNLIVEDNHTNANGGGMISLHEITLTNSLIQNNSAYAGGGLEIFNQATLANVTLTHNTAERGGAISNSGTLTLNNLTVTANATADMGGGDPGAGGIENTGAGTVHLANSLLAGNTGEEGADCLGTFTSDGYNLVQDLTGCTFNTTTGDQTGIDPLLGDLRDNGGLVWTYTLHPDSPAREAASPAVPGVYPACDGTDARGILRPGGDRCDIGAYEEGAYNYTVNTLTDETDLTLDGICDSSADPGLQCTLRAAIQETNVTPAIDAIFLPSGTYTLTIPGPVEQNAATGDLDVTRDLILIGEGAETTRVVGPNDWDDRLLDVNFTSNSLVQGISFEGGNEQAGAGVYLHVYATLTLREVWLQHNHATLLGGGVHSSGKLRIENGLLQENTADSHGGGIYQSADDFIPAYFSGSMVGNYAPMGGGIHARTPLTLENCTFTSNSAALYGGFGGGVYAFTTSITVQNCAFTDNHATLGGAIALTTGGTLEGKYAVFVQNTAENDTLEEGYGGAIYLNDSVADLQNMTFTENLSKQNGGAMFISGSTLSLLNVTVSNNQVSSGGVNTGTGGGLMISNSTVTLANTLLAGNDADTAPDCDGPITSADYNLIGDLTGCTFTPAEHDLTNLAPHLAAFNGQVVPLAPNSPALDAANPATCPADDQLHTLRPIDGDNDGVAVCDIGAYESEFVSYQVFMPVVQK